MSDKSKRWTADAMRDRLVRYEDLRPCYNAFIDTRTPGSEAKENFTIIGPGVSENPEQYVHISEPHGYNIGGARQPPNCVNSQHSHKTAEVFVVHSGKWRFDLGETGEDAQVLLSPGDVISLPTDMFRGFTNVGKDSGFLWAVLGQDDPGRVTWAPEVFRKAEEYGLVLLESGRLHDRATGAALPKGETPMPPTSRETVAAMKRVSQEEAEELVWRADGEDARTSQTLIGAGERWDWPHGFTLARAKIDAGGEMPEEAWKGSKVIFVHQGAAELHWEDDALAIQSGDTFSVPEALPHRLVSAPGAVIYIVREGEALSPE